MSNKLSFWKGKKVLLTGHTGFKGTWMSLMLENLGAEVCGYSLPLSEYSFYRKSGATVAEHHEGDIADRRELERVITGFKPEIVIHLASHSSLDGSDKIPDFILRTNIMGVVNLLDISRSLEYIKSIVIVTSDKCYRNLESEEPYVEECELGGEDPYSVSKVCQELITNCYQKTFFESDRRSACIATARASNVIGLGDYNISRLIPYILDNFKNSRCATLRNPNAIRPWQYVLDVIWGYLLLACKLYEENGSSLCYNGAYNFGPDAEGFQSVKDIVEILSIYFSDARYSFGEIERSVQMETNVLKLDSSKARERLRWQPLYSVKEMLRETAQLTMQEQKGVNTSNLCRNAIQEFIEKVN